MSRAIPALTRLPSLTYRDNLTCTRVSTLESTKERKRVVAVKVGRLLVYSSYAACLSVSTCLDTLAALNHASYSRYLPSV